MKNIVTARSASLRWSGGSEQHRKGAGRHGRDETTTKRSWDDRGKVYELSNKPDMNQGTRFRLWTSRIVCLHRNWILCHGKKDTFGKQERGVQPASLISISRGTDMPMDNSSGEGIYWLQIPGGRYLILKGSSISCFARMLYSENLAQDCIAIGYRGVVDNAQGFRGSTRGRRLHPGAGGPCSGAQSLIPACGSPLTSQIPSGPRSSIFQPCSSTIA